VGRGARGAPHRNHPAPYFRNLPRKAQGHGIDACSATAQSPLRSKEQASALMQWFRTKARATKLLVALFLVAQFAGVVPSPLLQAHAASGAAAAQASHHHSDGRHAGSHRADRHHDACAQLDAGTCTDHADYCCALHAFFAGILPPAAVIDNASVAGETLRPAVSRAALRHRSNRLDRPPRPLS
jgi:hypothetical protein